jgi:hypothetical protein
MACGKGLRLARIATPDRTQLATRAGERTGVQFGHAATAQETDADGVHVVCPI